MSGEDEVVREEIEYLNRGLSRVLDDYGLDGADLHMMTPDMDCVQSVGWKLPLFAGRVDGEWVHDVEFKESSLELKQGFLSRLLGRSKKRPELERNYHESFPLVAASPKGHSGLGVAMDEDSVLLKRLFGKHRYGVDFMQDLFDFREDAQSIYESYFCQNYGSEVLTWKKGLCEEDVGDYCGSSALVGDVWNDKCRANVFLFELMDDLDLGVVEPLNKSREQNAGLITALQVVADQTPFVKFPGKSYSQLVANFFQGVIRSGMSITTNVDLFMLGATNNGKTTMVSHIAPGKDKVETTHYYDVYFVRVDYDESEVGEGETDRMGVVVWDFGGQSRFWKRSDETPLPTYMLPELGERQPQVYVMTYAADNESTLQELREQVGLCRDAMGEEVWDYAYKVLVRTKTDLGGRILDGEMSLLAEKFEADDYAQVNALEDHYLIVDMFKSSFLKQFRKYYRDVEKGTKYSKQHLVQ